MLKCDNNRVHIENKLHKQLLYLQQSTLVWIWQMYDEVWGLSVI